jgi:hypothetical protein
VKRYGFALAALAACGGGGGSAAPALPPTPINASTLEGSWEGTIVEHHIPSGQISTGVVCVEIRRSSVVELTAFDMDIWPGPGPCPGPTFAPIYSGQVDTRGQIVAGLRRPTPQDFVEFRWTYSRQPDEIGGESSWSAGPNMPPSGTAMWHLRRAP